MPITKPRKTSTRATDDDRHHVAFRPVIGTAAEPRDAAADLVRYVKTAKGFRIRPHVSYSGLVTVRVYWQGDRFHTVRLTSAEDGGLIASYKPAADDTVPRLLRAWLAATDRFTTDGKRRKPKART